jgi:hypothetical protein
MTARLAAVSLVPFLELLMSRANPVRQLVTRAVDDSEAIWRIERKPLPCVGELGVSTLDRIGQNVAWKRHCLHDGGRLVWPAMSNPLDGKHDPRFSLSNDDDANAWFECVLQSAAAWDELAGIPRSPPRGRHHLPVSASVLASLRLGEASMLSYDAGSDKTVRS